MKIYLVRHGETLFNKKELVQGWCDSPLTDKGIKQALNLNKSLFKISFTKGYSSTSERAIDTLDYILKDRNIEKIHLKSLKEMNFGDLEGDDEKSAFKDFDYFEDSIIKHNGESFKQVTQRITSTLIDIAKENNGNVLVVSHGGVIMNFLLRIDEKKVKEFLSKGTFIENCSVTILNYDNNEFKIEVLADTSYCKGD